MLVGSAFGKVTLDTSGVQAGVESAQKSMQNLQKSGQALGQKLKDAGQALTVGLTLPLVAFGATSIQAAMDSENALTELNAVLKSTGNAAGVSAEEVTDFAEAMQKVTKFDDDAIVSGQSMLLTFTKIGKEVFPQASTAMLNMAEKFGSIDQAAMQLGKALNDPVAGVGALRRVGVSLSKQQEKQIQDFMAVNDIASAQKIILQELEVEFGGLAEAAGGTNAGKMAQFKNSLGDLQEVVGTALLPHLVRLTENIRSVVDWFMALPPSTQEAIVNFGIFLAVLGPLLSTLGSVISFISAVGPAMTAMSTATASAGPAMAAMSAGIASAGPAMGAMLAAAAPILPLILLIVAAIGLLAYTIANWDSLSTTWNQLMFIMAYYTQQAWDGIVAQFNSGLQAVQAASDTGLARVNAVVDGFLNGMSLLYEDGSGQLHNLAVAFGIPEKAAQDFLAQVWVILEGFRNGMSILYEDGSGQLLNLAMAFGIPEKAAQDFLTQVWLVVNNVRTAFNQMVQNIFAAVKVDWTVIGKNMMLGIANGIKASIQWVIDAARRAAQAAYDAAKKVLGIASPSKQFAYLGEMSGLGYLQGMNQSFDPNEMARSISRPMQNIASTSNQQTTMNFASGLTLRDSNRLFQEAEKRLAEKQLRVLGVNV